MKVVFIVALQQELLPRGSRLPCVSGANIVFCGLGKVNAAVAASDAVCSGANVVVSVGTAGSDTLALGTTVKCREFAQRDLEDIMAPKAAMVCSRHSPLIRTSVPARAWDSLQMPAATCNSGDNFVHSFSEIESAAMPAVVDMEAYAIAAVCVSRGVQMFAVKCVSDAADSSAWAGNVPLCTKSLENAICAVLRAVS